MKIDGHRLREHVWLAAPLLGLLTAVWALRWILASAGAPAWLVKGTSLTAAAPIALVLSVLLMHVRRFGSYSSVVALSLLLNGWVEALISAAIVFSVLTGFENVYTFPEFSLPGEDPYHLRHIYGHMTFGVGMSGLFGAAVGSLLLALLRWLAPLPGKEFRR